jgi:hypothetical protein
MCDLLLNYGAAIPGLKIGSRAVISQARRDLANLPLYTGRDKMLRKRIHRIHIDDTRIMIPRAIGVGGYRNRRDGRSGYAQSSSTASTTK